MIEIKSFTSDRITYISEAASLSAERVLSKNNPSLMNILDLINIVHACTCSNLIICTKEAQSKNKLLRNCDFVLPFSPEVNLESAYEYANKLVGMSRTIKEGYRLKTEDSISILTNLVIYGQFLRLDEMVDIALRHLQKERPSSPYERDYMRLGAASIVHMEMMGLIGDISCDASELGGEVTQTFYSNFFEAQKLLDLSSVHSTWESTLFNLIYTKNVYKPYESLGENGDSIAETARELTGAAMDFWEMPAIGLAVMQKAGCVEKINESIELGRLKFEPALKAIKDKQRLLNYICTQAKIGSKKDCEMISKEIVRTKKLYKRLGELANDFSSDDIPSIPKAFLNKAELTRMTNEKMEGEIKSKINSERVDGIDLLKPCDLSETLSYAILLGTKKMEGWIDYILPYSTERLQMELHFLLMNCARCLDSSMNPSNPSKVLNTFSGDEEGFDIESEYNIWLGIVKKAVKLSEF